MKPAKVITGISALRRACFQTTVRSGTPLARASLMNSLSSTSSMLERSRRTIPAAIDSPSTSAGSTKCFHEPIPEVGSQPSSTENTRIRTIASQNPGTDWPNTAMPRTSTSQMPPRFTAASTPIGTLSANVKTMVTVASRSEFRSGGPTNSIAGTRARIDVPKSP